MLLSQQRNLVQKTNQGLIESRQRELDYNSSIIMTDFGMISALISTKALPYQTFAIHLDTLFGVPPTAHLKDYLRVIKLQRQSGFKIPM